MKKFIFTFLTLFAFVALRAQVFYGENGADVARWNHSNDSIAKWRVQNHLSGMRTYAYKPDSTVISGYLRTEIKYDARGNMTEYIIRNKRGKIVTSYTYKWNDKGRYIAYTVYRRNGKFDHSIEFIYNDAGDEIERKNYWFKPNKMTNHGFMKYDERHNIMEAKYLIKNDKKPGWKYEYSYYDDGSKKQTIEYDNRGKIVHTWNYDCSTMGKLAFNKLKDTSKFCIRYETDKNGKRIKIKEEFLKNGNIARIINKYDINENLLEEIWFTKKGKSIHHIAYLYSAKNQLTELIEYKRNDSEIYKHEVYKYNPDGKATQMIIYKGDNKPKEIIKYEYIRG